MEGSLSYFINLRKSVAQLKAIGAREIYIKISKIVIDYLFLKTNLVITIFIHMELELKSPTDISEIISQNVQI